jgi:hypothetical protein
LASNTVTSFDYVTMHCAVVGWIEEATDEDGRERLTDLARLYFRWATKAAEQERQHLLCSLATDLSAYIDGDGDCPDRICNAAELEQVRAFNAVTLLGQLHDLSSDEMLDFADMTDGWAQTSGLHPLRSARLFGLADGLRDLAGAVGPDWYPDPEVTQSLTSVLVRAM